MKIHPKSFIGAVIAFAPFVCSSSATAGESLADAITKMLEYEPELRAAGYDTIAARHDQKIVAADLKPQVNVSGSAGLYNRDRSIDGLEQSTGDTLFSRQIGVNMRQLLWDFGEAGNRNRSAKNRAQMQQYMENAMVEARAVDMVEVFLEVIRLREQISISKRNIGAHQRVANAMRAKFDNGGDRADVALVEGRLQLAKTQLESHILALGHAEGRYERLTGTKPGDLEKPIKPALPNSKAGIDLSQNWYVLAADEAVKMAQHTREADEKTGAPKIYAEGGYSAGDDVLGIEGQDNEARALVVLSWNIFEGGRNKHRALRGKALEQKAIELAHGADAEQNYQATLLWSELNGAKTTITALSSYADKLESVSADYDEQFELGKRDILSILDVQNERHSADSRLLDARYEEIASRYRLLGLQGYLVSGLVGDRPGIGDRKSTGLFGKGSSKNPIPTPTPSVQVIPAVNGEFALAETQAAPIEIGFAGNPAKFEKKENGREAIHLQGGSLSNKQILAREAANAPAPPHRESLLRKLAFWK